LGTFGAFEAVTKMSDRDFAFKISSAIVYKNEQD